MHELCILAILCLADDRGPTKYRFSDVEQNILGGGDGESFEADRSPRDGSAEKKGERFRD